MQRCNGQQPDGWCNRSSCCIRRRSSKGWQILSNIGIFLICYNEKGRFCSDAETSFLLAVSTLCPRSKKKWTQHNKKSRPIGCHPVRRFHYFLFWKRFGFTAFRPTKPHASKSVATWILRQVLALVQARSAALFS